MLRQRFLECLTVAAALIALSGCVTLADRRMQVADLLDPAQLSEVDSRPRISLAIEETGNYQVAIRFDRVYEAKYDYSNTVSQALKQGLDRRFDIVPRQQGVPHLQVRLTGMVGKMTCRTGMGGDCTSTVLFRSDALLEQDQRPAIEDFVYGTGEASEGKFMFIESLVDPLHRAAAQNAFTDFVNRMTVWVNGRLVSRI